MAKRPDIYDPVIPPSIPGLALSATQQAIENANPITTRFQGRKYVITESLDLATSTVRIAEWGRGPAKNLVEARMRFDDHHLPLQLDVTLERGRPRGRSSTTQTYRREPAGILEGTPPIQKQPLNELFGETDTSIATYLLYVAACALAEAAPARRSRTRQFDRDETARGRYENQDFNVLEEHPKRYIPR